MFKVPTYLIIHNDWNVILINADFRTWNDDFLLKLKLVLLGLGVILQIINILGLFFNYIVVSDCIHSHSGSDLEMLNPIMNMQGILS